MDGVDSGRRCLAAAGPVTVDRASNRRVPLVQSLSAGPYPDRDPDLCRGPDRANAAIANTPIAPVGSAG